MRKGFTLVELSIVLVIIGLLIGGILVAQSLIESSKISAQIRLLQQYDIALDTFYSKFKQLPGDSNIFTTAGDNDGKIRHHPTANLFGCAWYATYGECNNYWKHLSDSGTIKEVYSNDTASGWVPGFNVPELKIGTGRVNTYHIFDIAGYEPSLYYFLVNEATGGGQAALTTTQALAIDKKIDDGTNAPNGKVRAASQTGYCVHPTAPYGYSTSTEGNICNITVRSTATIMN